ncbi:hypothetical protein DM02DRAFT_652039 [Periconia macrospinosa]|uniref:NACHT domain-containing protein n=1 Tax=Periconia macrospinosa TaxID=97972 RepID=A0A2V1E0E8_9PLEO|nr:hypothetical protein DM02DRAFT_652039 [Periconia macrospinosa]
MADGSTKNSKKSKSDRWFGELKKLTSRKGKTKNARQRSPNPASLSTAGSRASLNLGAAASNTASRPASPVSSTALLSVSNPPSTGTSIVPTGLSSTAASQTTPPFQNASQTQIGNPHHIGNVIEVDTDGTTLRKLALDTLKPKHREKLRFLDHSGEVTEELNKALSETEKKRDEYKKTGSAIHNNKKVIKLGEKADSILKWLDKIKAVGDVAANADPIHIGLPWAGIRFLLIGFVAARQESTAFLVGVEAVSYLANRMKVYVDYFHSLKLTSDAKLSFQGSLVDMYSTLFKFVAKALNRYERSRTTNVWKAFWSEGNVQKFENDCEKNAAVIERAAAQCDREQGTHQYDSLTKQLESLSGTRDHLRRLETKVDKIWEELEKDRQAAVLRWVSPILHEDLHYTAHDGITEGTGDWILQDPTFMNWDEGIGPKILWLAGTAGTGKTKLTAHSVEILKQKTTKNISSGLNNALAYFYFRKDDPQREHPLNALGSFLKQLIVRSGQIHTTVVQEYDNRRESGHLTFEEVLKVLCTVIQSYNEVYLIVDAFDECEETEQVDLRDVLARIVTACPQCRIFISGRPYESIKALLKDSAAVILDRFKNKSDIYMFIRDELVKCQKQRQSIGLPLISLETESLIVMKLTRGSGGMFQWVKLHMAQLFHLDTESDIQTALNDLPPGLDKTYDQIWQRMKRAPGRSFERAQRAIQWLLNCDRKLHKAGFLAAICQDTTSAPRNSDLQFESILRSCPGLLHLNSLNQVTFTHLSVKEYFRKFHMNLDHDGAMRTASICLHLLSHESTWKSYLGRGPWNPKKLDGLEELVQYASIAWAKRCCEAEKIGERTAGSMELFREFLELEARFLGPEMYSIPSKAYLHWAKTKLVGMEIIEDYSIKDLPPLHALEEIIHSNQPQPEYLNALTCLFLQHESPHLFSHSNLLKECYINDELNAGEMIYITRSLHETGSSCHDTEKRTKIDETNCNRAIELLGIALAQVFIGHSIGVKEHHYAASITPEIEREIGKMKDRRRRSMIDWCLKGYKTGNSNTWRRVLYLHVYDMGWFGNPGQLGN